MAPGAGLLCWTWFDPLFGQPWRGSHLSRVRLIRLRSQSGVHARNHIHIRPGGPGDGAIDAPSHDTRVSRDAFADHLRELILRRLADGQGPVGLYVERSLGRCKGVPHRLFKETKTKVKRAFGVGPQPVKPVILIKKWRSFLHIIWRNLGHAKRPQSPRNLPGPDRVA